MARPARSLSVADAFAVARKPHPMRGNIGGRARAQPQRKRAIALAPALDLAAQQMRAEPSADARETDTMDMRIGAQARAPSLRQRGRAAAAAAPAPHRRSGSARAAERTARAPRLLAAQPAGQRPPLQALDVERKLGAHRHRHFGGCGRRRRAAVGGKIDQRYVGLVSHRGNQRNEALRGRAHHDLFVERPQIFERAAAARDDDEDRAAAARPLPAAH